MLIYCPKCEAANEEGNVSCKSCDHRLAANPLCPNCHESLGRRKEPTRRSNFGCKKCGLRVFVDPEQELFPRAYLTKRQSDLVAFLWQLNHWVFCSGTIDDFYSAKKQIGKEDKDNTDDVVTDTIWFLMHQNLRSLTRYDKPFVQDLIAYFREDAKGW